MEAHIQEWLNILVRWVHVIAAIMWVGDSFLFAWLDSHLDPPTKERKDDPAMLGELWLVHGGGFYELCKRKYLRPDQLPSKLHWFKWESYTTWISGVLLLIIVYHMGGAVMLVDPSVMPIPTTVAVPLSLGLLVAGWLVYDALCRYVFKSNFRLAALIGWPLIIAVAYGLGHIFAPRASYLLTGAMLGTIMSANVFFRIIPGQRHMLAATRAGTPVDTSYGVRAKQRSMHNHYMTLPVLFAMLSNHFPSTYGHPHAWLVLALMFGFGLALKIAMNRRGDTPPIIFALGVCAFLGMVIMTSPPSLSKLAGNYANHPPVPFSRVQEIVTMRCVTCHATHPSMPAFPVAPSGIKLDTAQRVKLYASRVLVRSVVTQTMPLGNLTGMTADERLEIGAWVAQGASTDGAVAGAIFAAPEAPMPAGPLPGKSPTEQARAIFATRCTVCHGAGGAGDGLAAVSLNPKPRNYRDRTWQASVTDADLCKIIVEGGATVGKSEAMPPNPDLADRPEVVNELVRIVRAFGQP